MSANVNQWMKAVNEELKSMETNKVWKIMKNPGKIKPLKSKWVFKLKEDEYGNPIRYKARLVAKGYLQKPGVDYDETYSPVAKLTTLRIVLAVGVHKNMYFHQLDVKTAFLYGDLDENVYLNVPEGMQVEEPDVVLKLQKSLYGLKQSPRCWNNKFNSTLINLGFKRSAHDYCLYVRFKNSNTMYLLLYVDDVLIAGSSLDEINILKNELSKEFEMSDCGELKYYLGTVVKYDRNVGIMKFNQIKSINKLLQDFRMEDCKGARTPMEKGLQLSEASSNETSTNPYRELLGRLMYLMLSVRPDLCYPVGYLGRFQQNPSEQHWLALKRVLRYLKESLQLELEFRKVENSPKLVGYVDADWASNIVDRKSTSGYSFFAYGCLVSWSSKKQTTVATSSCEAEYVALSNSVSEGLWIKGILYDMNIMASNEPITIYEDNAGCIAMARNLESKRSKHIDVKHHFIRDHLIKGNLKIEQIPTSKQIADIFTKALDWNSFVTIRNLLMLN